MCAAIGIDLGYTYTRVGMWQGDHFEIIPNTQGNKATPSCIAFADAQQLVGDEAWAQVSTNWTNTVFGILRLVCGSWSDPSIQRDKKYWPFKVIAKGDKLYVRVQYRGSETDFSPTQLCALLLARIREFASTYVGKPVENAVIAVPACLPRRQQQIIKKAGAMAGLNILRLVNGSNAAAITYEWERGSPMKMDEKHILVFALGGGSLSVSVVVVEYGVSEVVATGGNIHLGGVDFDKRMVAHFVAEFKKKFGKDISGDARAVCRLQKACENAKRTLSTTTDASLGLDSLFEGHDFYTSITRKKFEELCEDLFQACLEPVQKVLQDANHSKAQIEEIVVVGGSSRIPKIKALLSSCFGKAAITSINPDESVAIGAAIQAAILTGIGGKRLEDKMLLDTTAITLGIEDKGGVMAPIIPRNSTIPCKKERTFTMRINPQATIPIKVYEGERSMAKDNNLLGFIDLSGLPLKPETDVQVEVTFDLDANEILLVSVEELSSKTKHRVAIDKAQNYGRMAKESQADKKALAGKHQAQLAQLKADFEKQLLQCKITERKLIAEDLLNKAFIMSDQAKPIEAACMVQIACELDKSEETAKIGDGLRAQVNEQMKLTEYEQQLQIEMRVASIKEEITFAEEQASKARSEEEKQMIKQQTDVLREKEKQLEDRLHKFDIEQKDLREREARVEKQEKLLSERATQLEKLLSELAENSAVDTTQFQPQMLSIAKSTKDIDVAYTHLASLQKRVGEAQQKLKAEEQKQRERVELLQKQIEFFQLKGMTPAQRSFRNYLKDVKRLSAVRNLTEHTPHPLRCFLSYAWETDATANKELQTRLQKLKDELEVAGMEVTLDIHNMKDDMKAFMVQGIDKSHKVLLICTPRLKVRAADTVKNNLQLELDTAVEKAKTTPGFIVPLVMSGTFSDAMPPQIAHLLSINFTLQPDYYNSMAALAPMGLIPMLLDLERNKDYKRIHDRLFGDLEDYAKQSKI